MINCVARLAGYKGIAGGQQADIATIAKVDPCQNRAEYLDYIHHHKTGAFMLICFETAAIAAKVDAASKKKLLRLARLLGLHFQIGDDILDHTGNKEIIGKEPQSDSRNKS